MWSKSWWACVIGTVIFTGMVVASVLFAYDEVFGASIRSPSQTQTR